MSCYLQLVWSSYLEYALGILTCKVIDFFGVYLSHMVNFNETRVHARFARIPLAIRVRGGMEFRETLVYNYIAKSTKINPLTVVS